MSSWLIRKANNQIVGPVSESEVKRMILDQQLGEKDEICRADHYWFYLDERSELKSQLSMELPQKKNQDDDDITEIDVPPPRPSPLRYLFEKIKMRFGSK